MPSAFSKAGRRPLNPTEAGVAVKLPRTLLDQIDAWAARNWCGRAPAIHALLERGLEASEND